VLDDPPADLEVGQHVERVGLSGDGAAGGVDERPDFGDEGGGVRDAIDRHPDNPAIIRRIRSVTPFRSASISASGRNLSTKMRQ